ncbi:MAG: DUF2059 domain-containing protein [Pseudomonadota bacterium]
MKKTLIAAASGLALAFTATPAAAQDAEATAEMEALSGMFGDMFGAADPLTAEQQVRVPAAKLVVAKLFPEGTYVKMMDETMRPMFEQMFGGALGGPAMTVGQLTGLSPLDLAGVDEAKLAEAAQLLDPNGAERNKAVGDMTINLISEIVVDIEPAYRAGLARAYAVRFTEAELTDMYAYFSTPVGSKYAAESFLVYADPQVMQAMNEMMPAMMERMPDMIGSIGEITEQFPVGRKFSELSESEQSQLAGLLGVSAEELATSEPAAANNNF